MSQHSSDPIDLGTGLGIVPESHREGLRSALAGRSGARGQLEAAASESESATLYAHLAHVCRAEGDLASAADYEASARALCRGASKDEAAHVDALLHDGEPRHVLGALAAHLRRHPDDAVVADRFVLLNFFRGGRGRRLRVERLFRWLASQNADAIWSISGRYGMSLVDRGNLIEGERVLKLARDQNPLNINVLHWTIHLHHMRNHHSEVIRLTADVHEQGVTPFASHLMWHRSLVHLAQGEVDEALHIYERHLLPEHNSGSEIVGLADRVSFACSLLTLGGELENRAISLLGREGDIAQHLRGPLFARTHAAVAAILTGHPVSDGSDVTCLTTDERDAWNEFVAAFSPILEHRYDEAITRLLAMPAADREAMGGSTIEAALFDELAIIAAQRSNRLSEVLDALGDRTGQISCHPVMAAHFTS